MWLVAKRQTQGKLYSAYFECRSEVQKRKKGYNCLGKHDFHQLNMALNGIFFK
jgi:hypothetical protein